MNSLLNRAHEIDADRFVDNIKREQLYKDVSDYNNEVFEVARLMKRNIDSPPTAYDREKLAMVKHFFKK